MSWDMYDMTQKVQVVVVAIVLPLVILAVSLWHDWVEEGQSPRARKIMKDWEWNIDEMAHAVNMKGRLIGYRVLQAGVIIYLGYSRFFRDFRRGGAGVQTSRAGLCGRLHGAFRRKRYDYAGGRYENGKRLQCGSFVPPTG